MVSVKSETQILPNTPISLLAWAVLHDQSIKHSIWTTHVELVKNLFAGATDEEDEDKAFNIIMSSESYTELAFMINKLSWDALDDDLDEGDLKQIAARLSTLRNWDEHAIDSVLRGLALNPQSFAQHQSADVDHSIYDRVTFLGEPGRVTLANDLLARRKPLLDAIARCALRNLPTRAREFIVLLDDLAKRLPGQAHALRALRWDAFYDNLICTQLEQARYRLLIATLPDMFDPNLPPEQRRALFDTLNRRNDEFRAMQSFINILGTVQQHTDVEWFMDALQLLMDNFTPDPPMPTIIQTIAAFFNSVASEIVGLRAAVMHTAQNLINSLSLGHLLEAEKDDKSRQVIAVLGQRLAVLPFQWKALLIHMMEEGNCDDDDEQGILQVLADSKARSIAEFAQLIAAQGWESLSFSFDGQEYDDLEQLLSKW